MRPPSLISSLIILFFLFAQARPLCAQPSPEKKYPTLLWEISGKGMKKPSYLFGTMHVSSKMVFHLSDSFYFGIRSTDVVALELDPQLWQDQLFRYQDLQSNLRSFTQGSPNEFLNEKSFQLDNYEDQLKSALSEEPTLINGLLYRTVQPRADFEEDTYLDLYIYQTGKKLGKQATGVENYFETERLIMEATQDMMKDRKKRNLDLDGESMYEIERKTQEAYRKGDLDMLDSLERILQPSNAFIEKFLYRRNEIQANSIDSILKKHSLFVGVGAAHLPGSRGVIEILRRMGYKLRPIRMRDQDAIQRENIDRVKVPVSFSPYLPDDGRFRIKVPGKMYKRSDSRSGDSWQYADMSNGVYYMITRIKTHAHMFGQRNDWVLKNIDSLLYENVPGKILKKKLISNNGWNGYDITNRTRRGDIQRYNIFQTPFEIIVFKMSGNGNYVEGHEAETFFGSLALKPKDPVSGWSEYEPPRGGFKARFPQTPTAYKNINGSESMPRWEYEANDSATGDAYMIWKRSIQNYRFLEEDSFELDLMEESLHLSDQVEKCVSRKFEKVEGHPALSAIYNCKDGARLEAKFIVNGPHYFLLAARTNNHSKNFSPFFDSFSFTPYKYSGFKNYADTILNIRVNTPIVPDIDVEVRNILEKATSEDYLNAINEHHNFWPRNKTALFQDDTTGEAIYVSVQRYPKYYYPKDTASFWEEETNEKKIREDFVIKKKEYFTKDGDSLFGYKYILSDTNSSKFINNWIFVKGKRLYRVICLTDSLHGQSEFEKNFFASLSPLPDNSQFSIFNNKIQGFFDDLMSKDSSRSQKAKDAIANVYFGPQGISLLLNAIANLSYNEKDYILIKSKLINELGYISDSTKEAEVIDGLSRIYAEVKDTSSLQNAVCRALAKHKTALSYQLLKKLILQDPPVFENSNDYNYLFQDLGDSLGLARRFYPEFLQLASVDDYKEPVLSLLTWLVDSNYINAPNYDSYFNQLYFDARMQLKKQQAKEEKGFQKRNEEININYYENGEHADENSALEDYAVLLLPFIEKKTEVQDFFDKLIKSRDASLRLFIATLLIRHNLPVDESVILKLASADQYRSKLYKNLVEIHKENLFPSKYKNQIDIAKSLLAQAKSEEEFFAIELVDKKFVRNGSDEGYAYFFRYKINKDDEWQMGISGLQPKDSSVLETDNEYVRLTNKRIRHDESILEQFNKQLKKLIFSKHKSASSFYLDNDYYVRRDDDD
jgi:uncharacterized protein YbaP (TraB family)